MRVVNQKRETITEYDLSAGKLYPIRLLKEDVDKTKSTYTKDDYEDASIYIPNKKESPKERIALLKKSLAASDYKVIKCAECQLLGLEAPYDVPKLYMQRQAIRDEINLLETQI